MSNSEYEKYKQSLKIEKIRYLNKGDKDYLFQIKYVEEMAKSTSHKRLCVKYWNMLSYSLLQHHCCGAEYEIQKKHFATLENKDKEESTEPKLIQLAIENNNALLDEDKDFIIIKQIKSIRCYEKKKKQSQQQNQKDIQVKIREKQEQLYRNENIDKDTEPQNQQSMDLQFQSIIPKRKKEDFIEDYLQSQSFQIKKLSENLEEVKQMIVSQKYQQQQIQENIQSFNKYQLIGNVELRSRVISLDSQIFIQFIIKRKKQNNNSKSKFINQQIPQDDKGKKKKTNTEMEENDDEIEDGDEAVFKFPKIKDFEEDQKDKMSQKAKKSTRKQTPKSTSIKKVVQN